LIEGVDSPCFPFITALLPGRGLAAVGKGVDILLISSFSSGRLGEAILTDMLNGYMKSMKKKKGKQKSKRYKREGKMEHILPLPHMLRTDR
jgi:hypothetical protein